MKITLIKDPSTKTENTEAERLQLSIKGDNLFISGLEGNSDISIFDISARLIAKIKTDNPVTSVNLQNKGVYIVQISDEKRKISRKIVY